MADSGGGSQEAKGGRDTAGRRFEGGQGQDRTGYSIYVCVVVVSRRKRLWRY